MIICFIAGQIRKKSLHKMSYYPEQIVIAETKKKVELDLSNYATNLSV